MEASLISSEALRGVWRSVEGTLKSSRAQMQARRHMKRSSERKGWLKVG
jgi:hypothetical protein